MSVCQGIGTGDSVFHHENDLNSIISKKIHALHSTECSKYCYLASDGDEAKGKSCQLETRLCMLPGFAVSLCLQSTKIVLALMLGSCSNFTYHIMYLVFPICAVDSSGLNLPYHLAKPDPCFYSLFDKSTF